MRKVFILAGIGLLLQSCSSLSKLRKRETNKFHTQLETLQSAEIEQIHVERIIFTDSVTQKTIIEITPIGLFSYHPQEGYVGMAENIKVSVKVSKNPVSIQESLNSIKHSSAEVLQLKEARLEKVEIKQKEQSSNLKMYILIMGGLIIAVLLWWKFR